MKGLLAPQNTFLDTIATRFDGTREWGGGWGWRFELGPRAGGQDFFGAGLVLLDVVRPGASRVELRF